jgi:RimJ/RimL family protein N-acetyltransferase
VQNKIDSCIPFLEANTIFLRGLCAEDVEGNYPNWFNSSEICLYNSHHRFPYTKDEAISYIKNLSNDKTKLVLAIIDKKSSRHIGNISLQCINYINRTAEIAFILGEKEYWGKGIATDAGELIIKHGFNELNLNRIYMGIIKDNTGMLKVAKKLRFTQEGIKRQALYKSGRYFDLVELGLLNEEWSKKFE